jgi:hypothetical protein
MQNCKALFDGLKFCSEKWKSCTQIMEENFSWLVNRKSNIGTMLPDYI